MLKLKVKRKRSKPQFKIINFYFLLLVLPFTFYLFTLCFAQPISSTELINNAKQYEGKTVIYKGEVIGDIMKRGNYAWLNVFDGANAIGVWLKIALTKDIAYTGSYKSKGDWIEVTGIFHRACPEHGGDLDIHAQAIRKVSSGRVVAEKLNSGKNNLAIFLLGILCVIWILILLKRR
jgi:hypothetical protein